MCEKSDGRRGARAIRQPRQMWEGRIARWADVCGRLILTARDVLCAPLRRWRKSRRARSRNPFSARKPLGGPCMPASANAQLLRRPESRNYAWFGSLRSAPRSGGGSPIAQAPSSSGGRLEPTDHGAGTIRLSPESLSKRRAIPFGVLVAAGPAASCGTYGTVRFGDPAPLFTGLFTPRWRLLRLHRLSSWRSRRHVRDKAGRARRRTLVAVERTDFRGGTRCPSRRP